MYGQTGEISTQRGLGEKKIFLNLLIAFLLAGIIGKMLDVHRHCGHLGASPGRKARRREAARRCGWGAQQ